MILSTSAQIQPQHSQLTVRSDFFSKRKIKKKNRKVKKESADKPGSVVDSHSSRADITICLQRPTRKQRGSRHCFPIWSCFRWGLPCRSVLPPARCALTAPFHPYRISERHRRYLFCCTFRRLTPPRRYLAPYPLKPGLSSRSCTSATSRDCLADSLYIFSPN